MYYNLIVKKGKRGFKMNGKIKKRLIVSLATISSIASLTAVPTSALASMQVVMEVIN